MTINEYTQEHSKQSLVAEPLRLANGKFNIQLSPFWAEGSEIGDEQKEKYWNKLAKRTYQRDRFIPTPPIQSPWTTDTQPWNPDVDRDTDTAIIFDPVTKNFRFSTKQGDAGAGCSNND